MTSNRRLHSNMVSPLAINPIQHNRIPDKLGAVFRKETISGHKRRPYSFPKTICTVMYLTWVLHLSTQVPYMLLNTGTPTNIGLPPDKKPMSPPGQVENVNIYYVKCYNENSFEIKMFGRWAAIAYLAYPSIRLGVYHVHGRAGETSFQPIHNCTYVHGLRTKFTCTRSLLYKLGNRRVKRTRAGKLFLHAYTGNLAVDVSRTISCKLRWT